MFKRLKSLFIRSGTARLLFVVLTVGILSVAAASFYALKDEPPVLTAIVPAVSSAGEVVAVEGRGFGDERGDSWIEISGTRISSSAYVSWSDTCIEFVVPQNYSDGLLCVRSRRGKSNVLVLSKKENIPQERVAAVDIAAPAVQSINPQAGSIGGLITIYGANFGITQGDSRVLFTKMQEEDARSRAEKEADTRPLIAQDDSSFGYDFWSDEEIRVRIPDGAASGPVYVQTAKGMRSPATSRIP